MPVVDGSTSTYPYTRAVYGALFWNYDNHPQFPESHPLRAMSPTSGSSTGRWTPSSPPPCPRKEAKAQAEAAGVELEYIPIAYDAMVFFTNAENSVTGLTQKQIQDIYVYGKYTNWNQVGGRTRSCFPTAATPTAAPTP